MTAFQTEVKCFSSPVYLGFDFFGSHTCLIRTSKTIEESYWLHNLTKAIIDQWRKVLYFFFTLLFWLYGGQRNEQCSGFCHCKTIINLKTQHQLKCGKFWKQATLKEFRTCSKRFVKISSRAWCILARVPHVIARAGARVSKKREWFTWN